jgi:DNA-binding transcriptional MerR regulator
MISLEIATVLEMEDFVRVKQAAAMLGVSPNTMRAWGADGKVPEYRHPVNNYRLYKRADLKKILRRLEKSISRFSKAERQSRVR